MQHQPPALAPSELRNLSQQSVSPWACRHGPCVLWLEAVHLHTAKGFQATPLDDAPVKCAAGGIVERGAPDARPA
jgi:hypothetical protein